MKQGPTSEQDDTEHVKLKGKTYQAVPVALASSDECVALEGNKQVQQGVQHFRVTTIHLDVVPGADIRPRQIYSFGGAEHNNKNRQGIRVVSAAFKVPWE